MQPLHHSWTKPSVYRQTTHDLRCLPMAAVVSADHCLPQSPHARKVCAQAISKRALMQLMLAWESVHHRAPSVPRAGGLSLSSACNQLGALQG